MRESILLEKLKTKSGESSLLIIFLLTGILIFICLPIVSIIFEQSMVKLAIQEITDQVDMSAYQIYQHLDVDSFSRLELDVAPEMLLSINKTLNLNHPQVKSIQLISLVLIKSELTQMVYEVELIMNPTLYRSFYKLDKKYTSTYRVQLPIDGE